MSGQCANISKSLRENRNLSHLPPSPAPNIKNLFTQFTIQQSSLIHSGTLQYVQVFETRT